MRRMRLIRYSSGRLNALGLLKVDLKPLALLLMSSGESFMSCMAAVLDIAVDDEKI